MNRFCAVLTIFLIVICATGVSAEDFSAAEVYRDGSPSVVLIFGFNTKGEGSAGTGSIVSSKGLILTNNHVIQDSGSNSPYPKITVYFKPERVTGDTKNDLKYGVKARVVARDPKIDLALIKVDRMPPSAQVISFGNSERAEIGSSVAAIGHPGGGGLWTLTTGTISSVRQEGSRAVFQTDTALNPGNSGGPLLDSNAHLIGVNTYVKRVNAQGLPLEGLNYSLRSELARRWLDGLDVRVAISAAPAAAAPSRTDRTRASDSNTRPASKPRRGAVTDDGARSYRTREGKMAFGVPNPDFDLEGTLSEVVARAKKNATDAFDELDEMSMDLDEDGF